MNPSLVVVVVVVVAVVAVTEKKYIYSKNTYKYIAKINK